MSFPYFFHLAVCWMYMKSVLGSWRTISRTCSPATGGHGYRRGGLIDKSTSSLPRSLGVRERDAQVPDPWTRCPSARSSLAPRAGGGGQLRNLASSWTQASATSSSCTLVSKVPSWSPRCARMNGIETRTRESTDPPNKDLDPG